MSLEESASKFELTPKAKYAALDVQLTNAGRALGELEMALNVLPKQLSSNSLYLHEMEVKITALVNTLFAMIEECDEPYDAVMREPGLSEDALQNARDRYNNIKERGQAAWDRVVEVQAFTSQS